VIQSRTREGPARHSAQNSEQKERFLPSHASTCVLFRERLVALASLPQRVLSSLRWKGGREPSDANERVRSLSGLRSTKIDDAQIEKKTPCRMPNALAVLRVSELFGGNPSRLKLVRSADSHLIFRQIMSSGDLARHL
jgi:hypothetical protein